MKFQATAIVAFAFLLSVAVSPSRVWSDQAVAESTAEIDVFGEGKLVVPAQFKKSEAQSRIIEHEFSATAGEGDDAPMARVTMMRAGGGVEANIDRWKGQFGGSDKKIGETEVVESGKLKVHTVKVTGEYTETMGGGPFSGGKKVKRPDYAMLGSILVDSNGRQYFVKMIGPAAVIEAHEAAFKKMVHSAGK
ncbi:hypothetical protein [Neorhodopirellula pilleata]|uniref:Preprotein translocase subunit SecD n=1 Tax=Neorhodopirellula pilleata TaxID=2714738 RepID=A0A5C6AAS6_9BACT|nr:hypothetical protein [Neorhodopirellula pilleata]TWT96418.1 hypothetical protein Pla100_28980 [Neorhodopirellula pilleata]